MILNRLQKNWKKLMPWAKRQNIDVFRLYDRDIPEFPFLVDVYADFVLVYDKTDALKDKDKNHLPLLIDALEKGLKFSPEKIVIKRRLRQEGKSQYEKLESRSEYFLVKEHGVSLEVNLFDYLDTGLFLDHRPIRQILFKEVKNLKQTSKPNVKVLNLFCYTGSVSVFAALAGAMVYSVDMSATYIEWAKRNFNYNSLPLEDHLFIQEDALAFLEKPVTLLFDFIFLDPPTFSNSKRMFESFEVERDQNFIINHSMLRLELNGILYFSTNKRDFKMNEDILKKYLVKNITAISIPQDCHDKKIHQCFEIRHKS